MTSRNMLTGKKATEYQKQLEANNVSVHIPVFIYPFLELRALLVRKIKSQENYFMVRHRYSASDRRLLDILYISKCEGVLDKEPVRPGPIDIFRYKRLRRLYRQELEFKHEWVRVTASDDKNPKFIWHEDINNDIV